MPTVPKPPEDTTEPDPVDAIKVTTVDPTLAANAALIEAGGQ